MNDRFCDRCGGKSSPFIPRTRVGDEMWCGMCALNHRTAAPELHPDNVWQARTFGAHHTTGGRVLGRHTGATRDEQEGRLADQAGWLHHSSFRPVRFAIEGARAYASKVGLGDPHEHGFDHVRQNADTVRTVGRLYDALPDHDKSADSHFHAMGKEVADQYHHLTHTMGINVQSVDHDPYRNVHEMVHDVENNKRLLVMGTHVTGGHPFFKDHENDQFRAVHDFFGHAATGRDFDRHGEQAAYLAHSKMFSPHARPALASETKGQNTSLILNGHFGPQKIAILPKHHWDDSSLRGADPRHAKLAGWSPEDVVRLEEQRQIVHRLPDGRQLCAAHLNSEHQRSDLEGATAAQAGLPHHFPDLTPQSIRTGVCHECAKGQRANEGMPWAQAPGGGFRSSPLQDRSTPRGWTDRPMRRHVDSFGPVDTTIRSLNRLAVALPGSNEGIRVVAHDSGDGETIFHCPFCGSGQVLARSDGAVDCEFCQTAFTVQVQPQMPSFPQTIDGVPVDVPGMPNGGQSANVPPGGAPPADGDPDADSANPFAADGDPDGAGGDDSGDDGSDGSDDDAGGDGKPPWMKKSSLNEDHYMQHLALHFLDRERVLAQVRHENGVAW